VDIYDSSGNSVYQYGYDSWGKIVSQTGPKTEIGTLNPFRYRGYYYDTETGLYYLNSRYYDPEVGRFINADSLIDSGHTLLGHNMFAYCNNNPVNSIDSTGYWATDIDSHLTLNKHIMFHKNKRPYVGEPGSTYEAPNGDKRTCGPDGKPLRDYDHNNHGNPKNHPSDENGGHYHDWDWDNEIPRGDPYVIESNTVEGIIVVATSIIGIAVVLADDITGVGTANDFLLGPLGGGLAKGIAMLP
jgi:RHS repeat-associated protein